MHGSMNGGLMMNENKNKDLEINLGTKKSVGNDPQGHTAKTEVSILGIGASAGGLEALSVSLGNVPKNSGLAFVIVQHMEKNNKRILVELLKNDISMKVVQAYENTSVHPDCVYVIPPNKNMSIKDNDIHIFDNLPQLNLMACREVQLRKV